MHATVAEQTQQQKGSGQVMEADITPEEAAADIVERMGTAALFSNSAVTPKASKPNSANISWCSKQSVAPVVPR